MPLILRLLPHTARKRAISRHFTIFKQKQTATQREFRIKPRKMPTFRPPRPNINTTNFFQTNHLKRAIHHQALEARYIYTSIAQHC